MKFWFLIMLFAFNSEAASVQMDQSTLIVVTHKGGVLSGLAHDHIVYARSFTSEANINKEDIQQSRIKFQFEVKNLTIDDPNFSKKWFPRLKELAILDQLADPLSDSDREGIKKTMLGDSQLDQDKFPLIEGELLDLKPAANSPYTHTGKVIVTIRKKPVEKQCPVRVKWVNEALEAEALCQFKFTEFDIEPISLFLGAVKNKDEFHVYVKIVHL